VPPLRRPGGQGNAVPPAPWREDEIIDVAVEIPRGSTLPGVLGAAAGAVGGASGNTTAWGAAGGMLGQRTNAASRGSFRPSCPPSPPPASTSWGGSRPESSEAGRTCIPVAYIDRDQFAVQQHRRGTVRVVEFADTSAGATVEFEAQNIGGLGLKELIAQLEA
jgi:hypothetical protein